MRLLPVRIPASSVTISALIYEPETSPRDTVLIFAHGFTSGKYSLDGLASYLAHKGYCGVTFDSVGHKLGATGGEMHHIVQSAEVLQEVLAWAKHTFVGKRIVLIGHSMGGAAVLHTIASGKDNVPQTLAGVLGAVCLCIGMYPSRGFEGVVGKAMLQQRQDYVAGAPARQLLNELDGVVEEATSNPVAVPVLFIAAKQDVLVSVERVQLLAERAGSLATLQTIDTSHLEAPDRARTTIMGWLSEKGW